jgi:hypothetical protein
MMFPRVTLVLLIATLSAAAGENLRERVLTYDPPCDCDVKALVFHSTEPKETGYKESCILKYETEYDPDEYKDYKVCIKDVKSLGIEAKFKDDCDTKKVTFKLDGPGIYYYKNTETTAPWSVFKNNGDDFYGSKDFQKGKYNLKVDTDCGSQTFKLNVDDYCSPGKLDCPSLY